MNFWLHSVNQRLFDFIIITTRHFGGKNVIKKTVSSHADTQKKEINIVCVWSWRPHIIYNIFVTLNSDFKTASRQSVSGLFSWCWSRTTE